MWTKKIYCQHCEKLLNRQAWYQKSTRCKPCYNKFILRTKSNPSFGRKHSEITKRKIGLAHLGRKLTKVSKQKISLAQIGKKHSKETKEKMSLSRWKFGSRTTYARVARSVYKEHNINILCDKCGTNINIQIHHKDHNWKNNNINNLQPLCQSCHMKYHRKEQELEKNALREK